MKRCISRRRALSAGAITKRGERRLSEEPRIAGGEGKKKEGTREYAAGRRVRSRDSSPQRRMAGTVAIAASYATVLAPGALSKLAMVEILYPCGPAVCRGYKRGSRYTQRRRRERRLGRKERIGTRGSLISRTEEVRANMRRHRPLRSPEPQICPISNGLT